MSYRHINSIWLKLNLLSLPTVLLLLSYSYPDGQYRHLPRHPIEKDGSYLRPLLLLHQSPNSPDSISSVSHFHSLLCSPTALIKVPTVFYLVYDNSVLSNFPASKQRTTPDHSNWPCPPYKMTLLCCKSDLRPLSGFPWLQDDVWIARLSLWKKKTWSLSFLLLCGPSAVWPSISAIS